MKGDSAGTKTTRYLLIASLALGMAATVGAGSRGKAPKKGASLPVFEFEALQQGAVTVVVVDHRGDRRNSADWIARVNEDVTKALTDAGITLANDSGPVVEVRLNMLRADFQDREWKGCSKLTIIVSSPELFEEISVRGENCVTKSNMWGGATANKALAQSYYDTLAEILSELDLELRETRSTEGQ